MFSSKNESLVLSEHLYLFCPLHFLERFGLKRAVEYFGCL